MITAIRFGRGSIADHKPMLVLGPALGTSARTLWSAAAERLADQFTVLAWDLPGHGLNLAEPDTDLSVADLAAGVLDLVEDAGARTFHYAGDSVGGAVGLALLLDAPARVDSAVLLCTGARIGTPESWRERVEALRASGTAGLVEAVGRRWFGPGFVEREPERAGALLRALSETSEAGYAAVCGALARFDVRDRLGSIEAPVLAVAGSDDVATPTANLEQIVAGVPGARLVVLDGVAHLAPAERPERVAELVLEHCLGIEPAPSSPATVLRPGEASGRVEPASAGWEAGLRVRREVLGDDHVERASATVTDLTRDFQALVTEYEWGGVWARPGLDRRSRSMVTITAMIALGHQVDLATHVRVARTNGLSVEEIREVILHSAVYCGVPAATAAFATAQQVLSDLGDL